MASDIAPGDLVECIKAPEHPDAPGYRLNVGAIYTAEWVGGGYFFRGRWPFRRRHLAGALRVRGDLLPEHCAWHIGDFRPVLRPKADLIESLLKKADEPISEDA